MNYKPYRLLGITLLASTISLQMPLAQAEIVTTDQLAVQQNADAERAKVQAFLDRANVKDRLLTMGIDGLVATDRVAALNDVEVHSLAEKIDALPAGGNFNNGELIIILLIAILVAIVL